MPADFRKRRAWLRTCLLLVGIALGAGARGEDIAEYRLKAAFLFNFAVFTEWPTDMGETLNLCIVGADPFGAEIDPLNGKKVGSRSLAVHRRAASESLKNCQIVFVAAAATPQWPRVLDQLRGQTVLTVADSAGAHQQGVALSMGLDQGRVTFRANLNAARAANLNLSSRLLRLATEVVQ